MKGQNLAKQEKKDYKIQYARRRSHASNRGSSRIHVPRIAETMLKRAGGIARLHQNRPKKYKKGLIN